MLALSEPCKGRFLLPTAFKQAEQETDEVFNKCCASLKDGSAVVVSPWPFSSMADLQAKLTQAWNWRNRRDLETRPLGVGMRVRREEPRKFMGERDE